MKAVSKTLLTVVTLLSLVNLAQAQTGFGTRQGRPNRSQLAANRANSRQGANDPTQGRIQSRNGSPRTGQGLPRVDFLVTSLTASGDTASATVKNFGLIQSPQTQLRLQVRSQATGAVLANKTARVSALQSGGTARIRIHSLPLSGGTTRIFATVDPSGNVQESNEANNSQAITVGAQPNTSPPTAPARPDLTVTSLTNSGNVLKMVIKNVGQTTAPESNMQIFIQSRSTGQVLVNRTRKVRSLNRNQSVTINDHTLTLDKVNVKVKIDFDSRIAERNETNNARNLAVGNQTEYTVDLKVTEVRFDRAASEVWVAVRNVGPTALSGSTTLRLQSYFGPGNRAERHSQRIRALNTGQQVFYRFAVQQMNTGMQFEGTVDPGNDLPEQNEQNNKLVKTFRG